MKIHQIIDCLETIASPSLQEGYDNAGLLTGQPAWECGGALCSLDATEEVIAEAIKRNCNLVIAHHPIIFGALKKINGKNYIERAVITAIKNDIALYAIHTNLDNVVGGVNGKMADLLELSERTVLQRKPSTLKKLFTFVPIDHADKVMAAIFDAGAGEIGNYSECSFAVEGTGTFKGLEGSNPYVGQPGQRHHEKELKIEAVFPGNLQQKVVNAMLAAHPYEEVAYDVLELVNTHPGIGSGLVGRFKEPVTEKKFLAMLKELFNTPVVRHTGLTGKKIEKVALCGGAGSFLIRTAVSAGADAFVTADLKYHEFFDADGRLLLCDIGHYESEQFTVDLLTDLLSQKFPTFAILKSEIRTNPVYYYI